MVSGSEWGVSLLMKPGIELALMSPPSCESLNPIERSSDGFLPLAKECIASGAIHRRAPGAIHSPVRAKLIGAFVEANPKSRRISGAKSCSFLNCRAYDRTIQDIRLKLHQKIICHHAAVCAQHVEMNSGVAFHCFDNFANLKGCGLERCAGEMPPIRKACESGNHTACIRFPVRSVETREGGNKINATVIFHCPCERI